MLERGDCVVSRRYTAGQVRLIVSSPADGSQDFYSVQVICGNAFPLGLGHNLVHHQFLVQIEILVFQICEQVDKICSHPAQDCAD